MGRPAEGWPWASGGGLAGGVGRRVGRGVSISSTTGDGPSVVSERRDGTEVEARLAWAQRAETSSREVATSARSALMAAVWSCEMRASVTPIMLAISLIARPSK